MQLLVLIESDWNLKGQILVFSNTGIHRINRIRLEFKVRGEITKANVTAAVLIESDWNLK